MKLHNETRVATLVNTDGSVSTYYANDSTGHLRNEISGGYAYSGISYGYGYKSDLAYIIDRAFMFIVRVISKIIMIAIIFVGIMLVTSFL